MALSNNPTQQQVVTEVKRLDNDKYDASNPNGYTSNAGTVTSVRVQAGTGLSSSTSTAQSTSLNTTISIASGYKLPTTTEWGNKADASAIPTAVSQLTNDSGYLTSVLGAYPVGAVYMSTSTTSPASLIGGTWQQLSDFQIPVGTSGTALPVRTGGRHSGTSYALNFDYISGSTSIQCNEQSKNYAVASNGVGLTISQLDGSSWGSNWGGWGTIIPNNLYANIDSDRLLTVHAWKRTA